VASTTSNSVRVKALRAMAEAKAGTPGPGDLFNFERMLKNFPASGDAQI
jgi:hypothetical protein